MKKLFIRLASIKQVTLNLILFSQVLLIAVLLFSATLHKHDLEGALYYAEMKIHENTEDITIDETGTEHGVGQMTTGQLNGWTFDAGIVNSGEGTTITAFATAGGGQMTVSSANALSNGDPVTITDTTNYNGVYLVANVSGSDFEITHGDSGDDGQGQWRHPSNLITGANAAGVYKLSNGMSWNKGAGGATVLEWHIFVNATEQEQLHIDRTITTTGIGAMALTGLVTVAAGDMLWMSVVSDTTNTVTYRNGNMSLIRVGV